MEPGLKIRAIALRQRGFSYPQIQKSLGYIPKGTLSHWFRNLELSPEASQRLQDNRMSKLKVTRTKALKVNAARVQERTEKLLADNRPLLQHLDSLPTAKIALAMLYLGEGSKNPKRSALVFGNSDPEVIALFLSLFRKCYQLDERKLRCTVQCRADQDTAQLKRFWVKITGVPSSQFYEAQVDQRTVGKPSKKLAYKGVCRVDYLSAEIFHDILQTIRVLKGS